MDKPTGIPWPMLRNSAGRPDAMLTLCVASSLTALACMLLGGSSLAWRGLSLKIPEADAAAVVSVLTFVAGYVVRRRDSAKATP